MSLTKATYSMISGAPANVLDFGADPTGTSNSTSAFNAALAAASTVYVPAGTYNVTSITVPDDKPTVIFGEGPQVSIIKGTQASATILAYLSDGSNSNRHSELRDIGIQGTTGTINIQAYNLGIHLNNVRSTGGAVGIYANNMVASNWTDVIANGTANGIKFERLAAPDVIWLCTFINCSTYTNHASGSYGWYSVETVSGGGYFVRECTFINADAEMCGTGFRFISNSVMNCTFIDSWAETCVDYTIYEDTGAVNRWIGYYIDNTGGSSTAFGTNTYRFAGWNGTDQQEYFGSMRSDFASKRKWLGPEIVHQISGSDVVKLQNSSASNYYDESVVNVNQNAYQKYRLSASRYGYLLAGVPSYANNAAAIAGGLVAGDIYRTGGDPDALCIVH